jgi:hypothetical protein
MTALYCIGAVGLLVLLCGVLIAVELLGEPTK